MMRSKRALGRFFTARNPFRHPAFLAWAERANLPGETVLEPFAGANSLIGYLEEMGLARRSASFDIAPAADRVRRRDTLRSFPAGYPVCVTNPPWLARNSATARGIPFPARPWDDLYKFALHKCLAHCGFVAALVPESFIRARLFQQRLADFISLPPGLFRDTGHPTGLALFEPGGTADVQIWAGSRRVGALAQIERERSRRTPDGPVVRFNAQDGDVGLYALDNTREASIRFCPGDELAGYHVKSTGRHITRLAVDGPIRIRSWNEFLAQFRERTHDVLLTCSKGVRRDGRWRRRLDWDLARSIIHHHA